MKQCKYIGEKTKSLIPPNHLCFYEIEKGVPIDYSYIIYANNKPIYYLDKYTFNQNFIDVQKIRKQKLQILKTISK